LTAQGEDLVAEVTAALSEIGFVVVDMDKERGDKGEKLEDLQVSDGDWRGIVEVKGYGGRRTARTNDLLQIGRAVVRYVMSIGSPPNAQWYVVNQMAGSDPSQRPKPLAANPDDVATFAASGGLVIDTAELFRIREAVRRGELAALDARQLLKDSKGVFGYVAGVE
jgi:hypothetical protein